MTHKRRENERERERERERFHHFMFGGVVEQSSLLAI